MLWAVKLSEPCPFGMTSPNPINVVLLPKATQVHCFSLQQYSPVSTVKSALRYMGDLSHIRFVTTAFQKEPMHRIHQGPIKAMTGHSTASASLFGLYHAYVVDSVYWTECSIVAYGKTALCETPEHTILKCWKGEMSLQVLYIVLYCLLKIK